MHRSSCEMFVYSATDLEVRRIVAIGISLFIPCSMIKYSTYMYVSPDLPIKMADKISDTILVYRVCITIFWSFAFLFFICEFADMVNNQFNQFNETVSYCEWYLLSIELQRLIIVLMANTQRQTTIHGYGNIVCTRVAFKKVNIDFFHCESITIESNLDFTSSF